MHPRRAVTFVALSVLSVTSLSACATPDPVRLVDHLKVNELSATMEIDELLPEDASAFVLGCPYSDVDALAASSGIDRELFRVGDRDLPGLTTDGPVALLPVIDGKVRPGVSYDTQHVSMCGTHNEATIDRGSTLTFAQDGYGQWFAVSVLPSEQA
ncbi:MULTISPECIES: hypothetical protein [unclassified Pseudoclavibacter]|uniref:hypothetical protein n=1 Tax=unclassified Pseudoclavibacter TaxID=2615177 RepID=UPI0011B0BB83|nr:MULTISPECIES: hypothetical protein [unclassified Pseudoclavibacter]MBF4458933.1 hypothetical protein [Pseudoclavibacter sp. VKM Ac-2867]VXC31897.1 conserved exported hypothetical protein [Pseudoclavibacter sp. 8L]